MNGTIKHHSISLITIKTEACRSLWRNSDVATTRVRHLGSIIAEGKRLDVLIRM